MSYQNGFFIGQPGHPGYPRPRTPFNNPGMQVHNLNYEYIARSRTVGPPHSFPRFNYSPNPNYPDLRARQPFNINGRCRFPPPYQRPDQQWNLGTPRRRFPIPTSFPAQVPIHFNNAQVQRGYGPVRRQYLKPAAENNFQPQSPFSLGANTRIPRDGYPRRVRHFTEVCASVNFTIRAGFEVTRGEIAEEMGAKRVKPCGGRVDEEMYPVEYADDQDQETGEVDTESSDDNPVAVESDTDVSPEAGSSSSETCCYDDETENDNPVDESDDSTIQVSSQVEEYDPEDSEIQNFDRNSKIPLYIPSSPNFTDSLQQQQRMASCDDEGFHEAFIGICLSAYPSVLGRMLEVAGFGVWFSDGNKRYAFAWLRGNNAQIFLTTNDEDGRNFSGVLKPDRPQNSKAVMIHGSAQCVEAMKRQGYSRIRINLETDYLNENVLGWIKKYMENPKAPPSNWDEVKYHQEILELCSSASGMIIKWSHCGDTSLKKSGIEKAKYFAKKATDSYMKELRYLQEAVGTTPS